MWACCGDTSSDDDEHNTSNAFLLLCAGALIAPVLLVCLADVDRLMFVCLTDVDRLMFVCLTDVDRLMFALGCRSALDVFTIAQQDDHSDHASRFLACTLALSPRSSYGARFLFWSLGCSRFL